MTARVGLLSLRPLDRAIRNAQHVTAREVLARLPADRFAVVAPGGGDVDPRLAAAPHVRLLDLGRRLRTARLVRAGLARDVHVLLHPNPDRHDARVERVLRSVRPGLGVAVHVVLAAEEARWEPAAFATLRRQVRDAALLTANSDHVGDTVEAAFGRRPVTVPGGVDLEVFRPTGAPPQEPFVVGVVGSFQARKRHDLVLEAARRLPGARFWVVGAGPGPLRPWFEEEVRSRGLRNVDVLEPVAPAELARRLAGSHALFHPSEHEGAPQVVVQAQACGCVPVARASTRPPTVAQGESGSLGGDDEALLAALERLAADRALRERLRAGGLTAASSRSWDVVAARWSDLLWETFSGRARASA